jgi:tetratricopeptide (TPR) repeat protein
MKVGNRSLSGRGRAVNEPGPVTEGDPRTTRPVFVSYATADRKEALSICKAIERYGAKCWISIRDVEPGANYQEAIVRAIRDARAMVLVFSRAANNSDEIKKELSLASRHRVPVMAVRIEDVEPSDAFAYELSTRQWIDAFSGWDKAIDALADRLAQISADAGEGAAPFVAVRRISRMRFARGAIGAAAALLLLVAAASAWFFLRPETAPARPLQVRLAGFQRLSSDLPAAMPDAMRDELIAAFGDDAIVGVSTAAAPPPGDAPAYALGGTLRRQGDKIKVIARLTNERTGTALWSNAFTYESAQMERVPRRVAIDTSAIARCGLFGPSTYPKKLSDAVLADYFQTCHSKMILDEPDKSLDFARKVVAAAPDFSWGWSAVEIAAYDALPPGPAGGPGDELRKEGLRAADRAVQLDSTNSEALAYKSMLIDQGDLVGRQRLLQQAIHVRALPCGCEHDFYGALLAEVGRLNDSISEFRRSINILALNPGSQVALGQTYLAIGRPDLAKEPIAAAIELDPNPNFAAQVRVINAPMTRDYARALKQINDPDHGAPLPARAGLSAAFKALQSDDPAAKTAAITALEAMPVAAHGGLYTFLLGALGANRQALAAVVDAAQRNRPGARSWLFTPMLAGALRDPSFPAAAEQLGLMKYWRTTHTKPDACAAKDPPPFCRMI